MSANNTLPISTQLLEILVCPLDHHPIRLEGLELICEHCGRRYPIVDGIPNMLIDED